MVIIKEDNLPPTQWKVGRIVKVYHGPHKMVRVADVRSSSGIFKRAIHNICPLPLEEETAQSPNDKEDLEGKITGT